jgi:uncharacterized protein (DUF342 family)
MIHTLQFSDVLSAVNAVQNAYLTGPFLESLGVWASGVADKFRESENSLTTELHALELSLSKLQSEVSAKGSIFQQQRETDERAERDLRERMEEETRRFEEDLKRKQAERKRYTAMLQEIEQMHTATMASMTARQKDLRLKLELEREAVLTEQVR